VDCQGVRHLLPLYTHVRRCDSMNLIGINEDDVLRSSSCRSRLLTSQAQYFRYHAALVQPYRIRAAPIDACGSAPSTFRKAPPSSFGSIGTLPSCRFSPGGLIPALFTLVVPHPCISKDINKHVLGLITQQPTRKQY
jgi:hypothetical protein